jgi:translation elongation factor EF-Tu-like GTPase
MSGLAIPELAMGNGLFTSTGARTEGSVGPPAQERTLFQVLDDVEPLPRDPLAPFRMSVIDRYKDMGTIAMGKSEAGLVRKGDRLFVMPNKRAHQPLLLLPPFSGVCLF